MPKLKKSTLPLSQLTSLASGFHIEMDKCGGGFSLICNGVLGIREFSATDICLKLPRLSILVSGTGLSVTVLEGKTVEILGRISEVKLKNVKG